MGRVYNALVRAEKWKEGDRPIGRPHRDDSPRGAREDEIPGPSFNAPAAATAQRAFGRNLPRTQDAPAAPAPPHHTAARSNNSDQSASTSPSLGPSQRPVAEASSPEASVIAFEEPTEVSNIQALPVDPRFALLTREEPLAVERYRGLALKLLNLADRRKMKTVLITSAESGEGKSTVAAALAWSLARRPQRRVLLIDANPASPSVARMFGIDSKRGWLNLVDRSCALEQAIIRLDPNGLYVMPCGAPSRSQSASALASRLEEVIAKLAPRFDLVVVDSPAILESPEAQRLAEVLDGAVLVARAGHTHHSRVTAARKLVQKERRLGVVLNESEANAEIAPGGRGKISISRRLFGRKK